MGGAQLVGISLGSWKIGICQTSTHFPNIERQCCNLKRFINFLMLGCCQFFPFAPRCLQRHKWWDCVARSRWFDEHLMAGPMSKAFCNGARRYADTIFRRLTLLIWRSYIRFFWFQRWTSAVVTGDDPEPSMLHSLRSSCSSWGWKGSVLPYSALFAMPSTIATVSGRVSKWFILSMLSLDLLVFVKYPWWAAAWVSPHNRATKRHVCALSRAGRVKDWRATLQSEWCNWPKGSPNLAREMFHFGH